MYAAEIFREAEMPVPPCSELVTLIIFLWNLYKSIVACCHERHPDRITTILQVSERVQLIEWGGASW